MLQFNTELIVDTRLMEVTLAAQAWLDLCDDIPWTVITTKPAFDSELQMERLLRQ
jgi:hypothetical protein